MLITVIDDEVLALKATVNAVKEALPEAEVRQFTKCSELLSFAAENRIDVAFLDINMRGYTGIEVAGKLEEINPRINIIFVTGYSEHKSEAMDMHASGYLMKPVVAADIASEMRFLRFPVKEEKSVRVRCFGNFSLEINGSPVHFAYKKTEELFAYLIDRKGAPVGYGELSAILWEDDTHANYLKRLRGDLIKTFEKCGQSEVIRCQKGTLSVDTEKISCDYYDYLSEKEGVSRAFLGEYMAQYSWAESTLGELLMK